MNLNLGNLWTKVSPEKGHTLENYDRFKQLENTLARNLAGLRQPSRCARENADRAFKKYIIASAPEGVINLDVLLNLYELASKYGGAIPCFVEFTNGVEELLAKSLK